MIVRTLDDAKNSERCVTADNWESVRLLLDEDKMGFSFHITTIYKGTETDIWYQNHLESVYCISGYGEVETCDDGKVYQIEPGTIYILDKNDKHKLRATTENLVFACVFNPALIGNETHDESGAYPILKDAA